MAHVPASLVRHQFTMGDGSEREEKSAPTVSVRRSAKTES
jgi:hypothetical protein